MKKHIGSFLGLFLFSAAAYASTPVFTCITYHPTTTFQIMDEGEDYNLRIYHHNGVEYLPLHTGTITPNDLTYLAQKADLFKKMGPYSEVRFAKKDCERAGVKWTCWGKGPTKIGGLDVGNVSLQTARKNTVYDEVYEWDNVVVNLGFRVGNHGYSLRHEYNISECAAP